MHGTYNFANYLIEGCSDDETGLAFCLPKMEGARYLFDVSLSKGGLLELIASFQEGFAQEGIKEGDRLIIIMGVSLDLYGLIIACFCSGVIPVFVDTGMGKKKIIMALEDANAKAIVSSTKLLKLFPFIQPLRKIRRYTCDGNVPFCRSIERLKSRVSSKRSPVAIDRKPDDHCLITFTSGSTGRPKGADRTHECLISQHLAMKDSKELFSTDVGLTCFPVAALHQLGCGIPTLLPRADLSSIAEFSPKQVADQIVQYNVSALGGAPAFISRLVDYLVSAGIKLSAVRLMVVGGSTVPTDLLERCCRCFPDADIQVVYGSTESEPISIISAKDVIKDDSDDGYLVGAPEDACEVLIVDTLNYELNTEEALIAAQCKSGDVGEIVVSGNHVLREYIDNPEATRKTKIRRSNGLVWHKTGDFGFLDDSDRLWIVGRDKDLIRYKGEFLPNYPIEKKLDRLAQVRRSAILNHDERVCLCVELEHPFEETLLPELQKICEPFAASDLYIYVVQKMPLDGRHNSKVDRPLLSQMIEQRCLECVSHATNFVATDEYPSLIEEWASPSRKIALGASLVLVLSILLFSDSNIISDLSLLVLCFLLQIPVVFGGVGHMYVVSRDLFPGLKRPIHSSLFGENKTWRGIVAVTLLTIGGTVLLLPLEAFQKLIFGSSLLQEYSLLLLGFAGGIGYVLGELPNSFIKRRLGATPGEMPKGNEKLFMAIDQIDSAIGCAFCFWLFGFPAQACLFFVVTFPITALIVKRYLYLYKLKDMAR